ncbi:CDP-diacylglycerol--serine O-phosphatidyltransferase [Nitrosomonas ureae]|uniref:CDP-diacylglycerol---serine O-phosphatidyltransferase n=1 Tax=Nitrosomonas ureae TaxID=44577 RepID=A0A1H9GBX5_9PROT|nr:CDP-diacylglycerol--serine O-phosphatidyltransferase [Nitrosomonas ureae]SEQ47577.1 CDP-diacylglycerol---serine O-phosphatidyltransferase [Nitrosomonas ureae]
MTNSNSIESLLKTTISYSDIAILLTPKDYLNQLLTLIERATTRIYITVLYLENDAAGRLIIKHLIIAKEKNPQLDIRVFVDFHRAHRQLEKQKYDIRNATFYREIDQQYPNFIRIYGVAIKSQELFGVMHLKGIVIDDTLIYTGASINNIYLNYHERYRYDRYWIIKSRELSNSFIDCLIYTFLSSKGVYQFNHQALGKINPLKKKEAVQYKHLTRARYHLDRNKNGDLTGAPLIGIGKRNNQLNNIIHQLMLQVKQHLVLYTPYFNLPEILKKDITYLLRSGIKVEIVVGDKHANDFFIPQDQAITMMGLIPYIYEINLLKFIKCHQRSIDEKLLLIRIWRHDANSFHLKGMNIDNRYHLLTGNNLNPRAWRLDFENGLLIDDRLGQLINLTDQEHRQVIKHTTIIKNGEQIETQFDYPIKVRKWLARLRWSNLDKLMKQYM